MAKKNKGLADQGDGDFILNESGTSVSVDKMESDDPDDNEDLQKKKNDQEEPYIPPVADPQKDITD
jgi:hypothetical protein